MDALATRGKFTEPQAPILTADKSPMLILYPNIGKNIHVRGVKFTPTCVENRPSNVVTVKSKRPCASP